MARAVAEQAPSSCPKRLAGNARERHVRDVKLYTIGYEHSGLARLIETLKQAGVKTLIDVRELPNSRRAGFSKRMLVATLAESGIGYLHLRALGTPKEGRIANRNRDWARFWDIVDTQLATPAAHEAFEHAARTARESTSCLLCLEADHKTCHRARVAEQMQKRYGFTVEHLAVHGMEDMSESEYANSPHPGGRQIPRSQVSAASQHVEHPQSVCVGPHRS